MYYPKLVLAPVHFAISCLKMHKVENSCTVYFNRFDIKWLKNEELHVYENVNRAKNLTKKEKKYIKGLHQRWNRGELPQKPSPGDIRALKKAYKNSQRYLSVCYQCNIASFFNEYYSS